LEIRLDGANQIDPIEQIRRCAHVSPQRWLAQRVRAKRGPSGGLRP